MFDNLVPFINHFLDNQTWPEQGRVMAVISYAFTIIITINIKLYVCKKWLKKYITSVYIIYHYRYYTIIPYIQFFVNNAIYFVTSVRPVRYLQTFDTNSWRNDLLYHFGSIWIFLQSSFENNFSGLAEKCPTQNTGHYLHSNANNRPKKN